MCGRDEELESLREAFIIYTQILVSQALESSFVASLLQDPGTVLVVEPFSVTVARHDSG